MHRKTPSWNGVERPSFVRGGDALGRGFESCGDLEDACCNRRRSHSHDLPDPRTERRRKVGLGVALLVAASTAFVALRPTRNFRPAPPSAFPRILLADDDVAAPGLDAAAGGSSPSPLESDADSRYEALLKKGFGPPADGARDVVNSTTQKPTRSKTQRKRDERQAVAAEKRRLARADVAADAFEQRKVDRVNRKQKERDDKRAKREVIAIMQGGSEVERSRRR